MNIYFMGVLVSTLFYVVCYIATNNLLISIIPCALALIYFSCFVPLQTNQYKKKIQYFKLTNQFVNSFIVSLSIQPAIDLAYSNALSSLNFDFGNKLTGSEDMNAIEKLQYLGNYFTFHPYFVFVQIVDLWQEQGGDILKMTNFLTNQFREMEEYIITCKQIGEKRTIEFSILWLFALSILAVIRFVLSQFYSVLINNKIFIGGIFVIFVFVLVSIQILISKVCRLDLKGWKKYDK